MTTDKRSPVHGPICVDRQDQGLVISHSWRRQQSGYAVRCETVCNRPNRKWRFVSLHRVIAGANHGQIVDHINRDILDNRRSNLRICTHSENVVNRGAAKNSAAGFRGVVPVAQRFRAQISMNGRYHHLGYFNTAQDAAHAYNKAAASLHGDFAITSTASAALPPITPEAP